jgi:hypothetical protein
VKGLDEGWGSQKTYLTKKKKEKKNIAQINE